MNTVSTNLPLQLTSFIGREREIDEAKRLLESARLLTLTGAGGAGKTRLAIQVATEACAEFKDGVWFIDIAPLNDPTLVPQTVATVFGLQEYGNRSIVDALRACLREKQLLLLLDNCEHLIEACAHFADGILRNATQVSILATSREPLSIAGEITFRVPSLSLPDPENSPPLESVTQCDAVRLFVARARAVCSTFVLTEQNVQTVVQICQRLDGMPLAIELAAARVKALSVDEIAARLEDRFRLLANSGRKVVPRQQTLRATMDWSYDLLSDQERVLLRRLSVFAGGWTLQAAEAICPNGHLDSRAILDVQTQLIDKSLVVMNEPSGHVRYQFLETVREYAQEKLLDSNEGESIRNRHLDYYTLWSEEVEPKLHCAEQLIWIKKLEVESDNLRSALEWSLENNVESGLRLANALVWVWGLRTQKREGWEWLEQLLARSPQSLSRARVKALCGGAEISAYLANPNRAERLVEQAQSLAQAIKDKYCLARSLFSWGLIRWYQTDFVRALELYQDSLVLFRELEDDWWIAYTLANLGFLVREQILDNNRARTALEESSEIFGRLGDTYGKQLVLVGFGWIAYLQGDYVRARALFEERLSPLRDLGDQLAMARALNQLGDVASALGDYAEAVKQYEASLKLRRDYVINLEILNTLARLGFAKFHLGDPVTAWSYISDALHLAIQGGNGRDIGSCLNLLGIICLGRNQIKPAVRIFGAANVLCESVHLRPWIAIRSEIERNIVAARKQLGESAFDAAWNAGSALTLEQAIAEAPQGSAQFESAEQKKSADAPQYPAGLTRREVEVLRLVAIGLSNHEIARQLVLSKRTVHAHLRSIFGKLDVTTRSAATRVAIDHKMV